MRQINISALELRIGDMEDPARIRTLVSAVRGTADNPPYLLITLVANGVTRDYLAELKMADPQLAR